jgi:predicted Fe-S protein YdhL (DUF1289 family)
MIVVKMLAMMIGVMVATMTAMIMAKGGIMTRQAEPASPCVDICVLDDADVCMGCYRSAQEIAEWSQLAHADRWCVLDNARERRRRDGALL